MNFTEFIGFIITLLAFFLLVGKQARDERKRRQNPELYEEEQMKQQEAVKELLKSLNIEVDSEMLPPQEEEVPPPPPEEIKPPVKKPPVPRRLAEFDRKDVYKDPYAMKNQFKHEKPYQLKEIQQKHIKKLVKKSGSLKDAIVLKEILGPPKGLQ